MITSLNPDHYGMIGNQLPASEAITLSTYTYPDRSAIFIVLEHLNNGDLHIRNLHAADPPKPEDEDQIISSETVVVEFVYWPSFGPHINQIKRNHAQ